MYASPNPRKREEFWENINNIAGTMNCPWMLAGDFNDSSLTTEKKKYDPQPYTKKLQVLE